MSHCAFLSVRAEITANKNKHYSFFCVEFFKKDRLTSTFKSIHHLTQNKTTEKPKQRKKKMKKIVITFVLCVCLWQCSQKLHGVEVSGRKSTI